HPSSPSSAATRNNAGQGEEPPEKANPAKNQKDNQKQDDLGWQSKGPGSLRDGSGARHRLVEADATVLSDNRGNLRGQLKQRWTVLVLAQQRHHLPAEAADLAVRQYGFEAVANFDAVLAILNGE